MENCEGLYFETNQCSNELITRLRALFNDHGPDSSWLLMQLNDPASKGAFASLTTVFIQKDKVILQPSEVLTDNPEDYAVEINRSELIAITNEWQRLMLQGAPLIYIYCQNGKSFVSETLPAGVE